MGKKDLPHVLQRAYIRGFTDSNGGFFLFGKDTKGNITCTVTKNTNNMIFRNEEYFNDDFDREFIKPLEDWFGNFIQELRKWTPLDTLLEQEDVKGKKNSVSMIDYLVMQYFRNERNFEVLGGESRERDLSVEEMMRLKHKELVNRFLDALYSQKLFVEIKSIDKGIDGEHAKRPFHFITGDFPFHAFNEIDHQYTWKGETFFPFTSKLGVLLTTNRKRVSRISPEDQYSFVSRMNYSIAINSMKYLLSPVRDFCGVEDISKRNAYWQGIIHAQIRLDGPRTLIGKVSRLFSGLMCS
ncbi:MAG: hypothetical protein JW765_04315 [Deltaproteobacteria bacterium]|nr:hypothetical protein [Candidatus Zymogenaceae bacterium]